jgi:hypothetical protein
MNSRCGLILSPDAINNPALIIIYSNPEGKRGDDKSFVNSSHRFAGFLCVPPRRSMYCRTKSKPRL